MLSGDDSPELTEPLEDQVAEQNFRVRLPSAVGTFTPYDPANDVLVLSATLADETPLFWLTFDPDQGLFSGTPGAADVGLVNLKVRADDAGADGDINTTGDNGGFTYDYFTLTVTNVNDAPAVALVVPAQTVFEDQIQTINTNSRPTFSWTLMKILWP